VLEELAPDVWQVQAPLRNLVNAYVIGDVLIDSGTRIDTGRIVRALRGHKRAIKAHALTHAHPDHLGSSHAVCQTFDVPFWVSPDDTAAAEEPRLIADAMAARAPFAALKPAARLLAGAYLASQVPRGHPVDRGLQAGDQVAGFEVMATPGHTAGHVSFWRESDRTLILGDVLNGMNLITTIPGLHEPVGIFTPDPERNRQSAKRLGELEPALVCFGHGPPLRDTRKFVDFCASLP
jgi:hydroxyacylglutathione hydrolase